MLKINELFGSYQGEGILAGAKTYFIRLQGCNLKCEWCDSKRTWGGNESKPMTADQIIKSIHDDGYLGHNVCLTGGEPLLQQDDPEFLELLRKLTSVHLSTVSIETNGTIKPKDEVIRRISYFAISPKLQCMGGKESVDAALLKEFDTRIFLINPSARVIYKFVVSAAPDKFKECLAEINSIKDAVDMPSQDIFLMPEGTIKEEVIIRTEALMNMKHPYSVSTRQHIIFKQR